MSMLLHVVFATASARVNGAVCHAAIVLQGSGNDNPILALLLGNSFAYHVRRQSSLPIYLRSKCGFRLVNGQGQASDKGLRSANPADPSLRSPAHAEFAPLIPTAA